MCQDILPQFVHKLRAGFFGARSAEKLVTGRKKGENTDGKNQRKNMAKSERSNGNNLLEQRTAAPESYGDVTITLKAA